MGRPSVCGVVLSGGMSRRFQLPGEPWVDKALFPVEGVPMLVRAYRAVRQVAGEVVVAAGVPERAEAYRRLVGEAEVVADAAGLVGPLAGLLAALEACGAEVAVAVPVDMPFLAPDLLGALAEVAERFDVASPVLPNGLVETAVVAVRREAGLAVLGRLRGLGRARVADLHRGVPRLFLLDARGRGVDARAFLNVNRREDLSRGAAYPEGPLSGDVELVRPFGLDDLEGAPTERLRGSLWWTLATGDPYDEFRAYLSRGVYMLAAYALMDSRNPLERHAGEALLGLVQP